MKLTLLCGANPKVAKDGPSVRVQAGAWRIEEDGIKSSKYSVFLDDVVLQDIHKEFTVEKAGVMRVAFTERGSEPCVSIWARRVA